jgi:predicted transglutaminase-like cysteine proteinase
MTIAVSKTLHLVRSVLLCACIALFAGPDCSNAADQHSKPVRIVMLSPVGTAADLAAPMFADPLTQRSRRLEYVNNGRGAEGIIAVTISIGEHANKEIFSSILTHFQFNALAPMAHTRFCLTYQDDCKVGKTVIDDDVRGLTAERRAELIRINAEVNRAITSEPNLKGLAGEKWLIAPKSGNCDDYAVTKRHELLARGWPAKDLLLAEVVIGWYSWDPHHLVLVARTDAGDFVLDNLNAKIRPWTETSYQWVRIQSPKNPLFWIAIASTPVLAHLL